MGQGELISKGMYGCVYLGLNASTGEMIAVKQVEMPKDQGDTWLASTLDTLKSEINILKSLNHWHVVQYLGSEQSATHFSL
jgi:serine/threonine protein kinase